MASHHARGGIPGMAPGSGAETGFSAVSEATSGLWHVTGTDVSHLAEDETPGETAASVPCSTAQLGRTMTKLGKKEHRRGGDESGEGNDDHGENDMAAFLPGHGPRPSAARGKPVAGYDIYELSELDMSPVPQDEDEDGEEDGEDGGGGSKEEAPFTLEEERAVVKKLDRRLVMFVAGLYLLSFLDRSNIGNARIAGLDDDLQPSPPDAGLYEWCLTAFYAAYIAFEWAAILWTTVPAHALIAGVVLSWGVVASLQAVAVSYPMLIGLRAALGAGEAAFAGIPFYLSFFYRRDEMALRTAMFISAAPLATTFASSLAWLITSLAARGPIAPWRLLFIVEGFPAVLVSVVAWSRIPDSPQTAPFLTRRERRIARLRLRPRGMPSPRAAPSTGPSRRDAGSCRQRTGGSALLSALGDPAAWLTAAIFFLANMAYASLPVFLPTILEDMGHTPAVAQALAAPPYLVAFVVVLATARASDAMRARAPLLIAHALASTAGYGVLAFAEALGLEAGSMIRYLAVFPATAGFFGVVVLTVSWSINNGDHGTGEAGGGEEGVGRGVGAEAREQKRRGAWGFALLQAVGQCGPLVGTRLYPDDDAPYFSPGMRACAGAMLGVALLASGLRWYLGLMNRRMDMEDNADGGGDGDEMTARLWQGDGVTRQAEEQGSGDGGVDEAESLVARPRSRRSCEKGRGSDAAAGRFRYML